MSNPEMSQYLGVFLDEAQEQLDLFESHLLGLERTDDSDAELQVLFRAAHTLKGSSKAMGFVALGDLTHEMENVLDGLRSHEIALSISVVDVLLRCLDALKSLVIGVSQSGGELEADPCEFEDVIGALNEIRGASAPDSAQSPAPAAKPNTSTPLGNEARIRVRISESCPMKSIRALLILGSLEGFGEIVETVPERQALEDEQFDSMFEVAIKTDQPVSEIIDAVCKLVDVVSVEDVESQKPAETKTSAPAAGSGTPSVGPPASSATVRVDVARLDKLLNLVGELVTDRTQLVTLTSKLRTRYSEDEDLGLLVEGINRFGRVTSELQEEVMKSRMLPINGVFQRMPRMVRDLAHKMGKEVDFDMTGGETELDRSVLEILGDPLIHLLRNAIDHGIENPSQRVAAGKPARGRVVLSARQERSQILIEIEDDGKGIDPARMRAAAVEKGILGESVAEAMSDREAVQLVFAPGFTTAEALSEVSGRGVGMDIVRSNIERVGGRILIDSTVGLGCRFMIYLPLTLAIVSAVLVVAEGSTYAIPLTSVTEMVSLEDAEGEPIQSSAGGQAALMLRGKTLPLASFADVLSGNHMAVDPVRVARNSYAVVIRHGEGEAALSVDSLQGETEVVIKPLGTLFKDIPGVSGASILGDGRVALIVDPSKALEELYRSQVAA